MFWQIERESMTDDISDETGMKDNSESFLQIENARLITILALAKLAEYRDDDTGLHLERMREYTKIITQEMAKKLPIVIMKGGMERDILKDSKEIRFHFQQES
jgi:response regulator RpfG family c-di-GMP phosphodiesterase